MHVIQRRYAVIEAPSVLGLRPTGVDQLSSTLIRNGLMARLAARHAARVEGLPYSAERDRDTRTLNPHGIAQWSPRLADAVEQAVERGDCPVILGGDCSILLGAMLAFRRRGRFGLLFIDGHADFYQPEVNPNGEAASMELAFAVGYGPSVLTDFEGRRPLVRSSDVVAFGFRDRDEQQRYGSQPLPPDLLAFELDRVRNVGIASAAAASLERVVRPDLEGFVIHFDVDVLDDAVMPAVDYRLPDGLSWKDATILLQTAMATGRVAGFEVTIYNPSLDPDGSAGRALTDMLAAALGTSAAWHT
jgi:arginase